MKLWPERPNAVESRKNEWDSIWNSEISQLAYEGGTPLNDVFATGQGVMNLVNYVAALERRVARLEGTEF